MLNEIEYFHPEITMSMNLHLFMISEYATPKVIPKRTSAVAQTARRMITFFFIDAVAIDCSSLKDFRMYQT